MVIVENQIVELCWTNNNREHLENKGYEFTKYRDKVNVRVEDLQPNSQVEVQAICNDCSKKFNKPLARLNNSSGHYCSKECAYKNRNGVNSNKTIEESIEGLQSLFSKLGKCPTVKEYDEYARENGFITRRVLEGKLNKKWTEICDDVLGEKTRHLMSKEEIITMLTSLKNDLKRTPMTQDLKERGYNFRQIYRVFNMTYNELLLSLGWELTGHISLNKTDEEMLEDFLKLHNRLNRLPTYNDIDETFDMCSSGTYRKKFKNLFEICKLLKINYNVAEFGSGEGYACLDKNGDICRSIPESIITNYLIENNITYEKEVMYKKVIKKLDKRIVCDWYLPRENVIIEYFGLYRENANKGRMKKYKDKVIYKIELCKENDITIIPLFPDDMKNDLLGVKEKLKKYIN